MRGDQYSTLVVKVPTKLTSEQKELIKKFDAVSGNTLNEFGEDKHETAEDKIKKFFKNNRKNTPYNGKAEIIQIKTLAV